MSAIYGQLRFDGSDVDPRDIDRMAATLAPRCPDGQASFVDGPLGLGHGLLRVTREDAFDEQPLYDRDARLVLVFDGRIDNREDLAEALSIDTATLATMPDSAVVLHAYRAWGDPCADRLLGDFAFALWDAGQRHLMLARDAMGQRSLHYHLGDDFIAFATEKNPVLATPGVPRGFNEAWLEKLAANDRPMRSGRVVSPHIGMSSLAGGSTLIVTAAGETRERRFWEPRADPAHLGKDEAYYIAAYRRVLEEAVACRVRRLTAPPGIMLSGGFDSSAVAGLSGRWIDPAVGKLVAVCTVMPDREGGWRRDPRPWVARCARDMPHLDLRYLDYRDIDILDGLDQVFHAKDSGPANQFHHIEPDQLAVMQAAGCRMALDGHGGDITLNHRGHHHLPYLATQGHWRELLRAIRDERRMTGHSWYKVIVVNLLRPLIAPGVVAAWDAVRSGFRPKSQLIALNPAYRRAVRASNGSSPKAEPKASRFDSRAQTAQMLAGVANSPAPPLALEAARRGMDVSRPFYDKRVVELALAIPQALDVRHGRTRYLACMALRDIYPPEFQTRPRTNETIYGDSDQGTPEREARIADVDARLLAEVQRLSATRLARFYDFDGIAALIRGNGKPLGDRKREQMRMDGIRSLLSARFVEWLDRRNAP